MIDFRHIPLHPSVGSPTVSLNEIFKTAENTEFAPTVERLKNEARLLCREVLKGLIPELDLLEKNHSSNPSKLRIEMLARIEDSLSLLEKRDSEAVSKIGRSLGLDPDLFPEPKAYVAALSQFIAEKLHNPGDFAVALNVVSAGDLVKSLAQHGRVSLSLSERLIKLSVNISELLAALRRERAPFLPTPFPQPAATRTQDLKRDDAPALFWNRAKDQYGLQHEDQKPSTIDLISQACNDLGVSAQQKNKAEEAKHKVEEQLSACKEQKTLLEFLDNYPQFKDQLLEKLGDRHFTDGPVTLIQKLAALDEVLKKLRLSSSREVAPEPTS